MYAKSQARKRSISALLLIYGFRVLMFQNIWKYGAYWSIFRFIILFSLILIQERDFLSNRCLFILNWSFICLQLIHIFNIDEIFVKIWETLGKLQRFAIFRLLFCLEILVYDLMNLIKLLFESFEAILELLHVGDVHVFILEEVAVTVKGLKFDSSF